MLAKIAYQTREVPDAMEKKSEVLLQAEIVRTKNSIRISRLKFFTFPPSFSY